MRWEGASNEHASIKEFRKNWDAALELIETRNATGFYTPAVVPPPTVGNPPKMLLGDELEAEIFKSEEGGSFKSGVELRWIPVGEQLCRSAHGRSRFCRLQGVFVPRRHRRSLGVAGHHQQRPGEHPGRAGGFPT